MTFSLAAFRKYMHAVALPALLTAILCACHPEPDYKMLSATDNLDLLWRTLDEHYCFFGEKDIDWEEIHRQYTDSLCLHTSMTQDEFFTLCASMLNELKDGHVNLASSFNTSYYRRWWTDYPQDFDLRCLQQYYLDFDYLQTSGISYKFMPDSIGYMYYPSFAYNVGETNLDYILYYFRNSKALIIDIRDNGGGMLTNIDTFVGRFISKDMTGAFISHKTGPGHDEFSDPYPVVYKPCEKGRVSYLDRPIMLLTNRSCFSAANSFAAVMKQLPNVRIAGARTGGGGGLPFSSELPIGWSVRFSACPMTDANGLSIENGIDPSPGCEMHCTPEELAQGTDAILDFALRTLSRPHDPEILRNRP